MVSSSNSKKMDKSTVLKSTISYLKNYQGKDIFTVVKSFILQMYISELVVVKTDEDLLFLCLPYYFSGLVRVKPY